MSWETTLFTSIRFNRKTYDSRYEVESDLDELNKCIKNAEQELTSLALITEPEKFFNKDEESDLMWTITQRVRDTLELLEEQYVERNDLTRLLDVWDDCHNENGLAIPCPDNVQWNSSFLEGDFIKTVNDEDSRD